MGTCPWLVAGDFNIIVEDGERIGGHPRAISAMDEFNACLDSYGLLDLSISGSHVSWCNGHSGTSHPTIGHVWIDLCVILFFQVTFQKFGMNTFHENRQIIV
ncbi:hypothetical protein I3760_10G158300 [Carya illinoinensis]|nr:hypothetical protein I3760_10G158300 [Carya illinoinensis]